MTPQFTYDNKGNAVGVFLPIEDWDKLKSKYLELDVSDDLPQWQKDLFDERYDLLQSHPEQVTSLEDFLKEMEQEADEEL